MHLRRAVRARVTEVSESLRLSPARLINRAALVGASTSLLGALAAVIVHPVFWLAAVGALAGTLFVLLLGSTAVTSHRRKPNANPKRITDAQVKAVLASHKGLITASRLASMTRSTPAAAAAKLRSMAVDGDLTVDSETSLDELVYVVPDGGALQHDR